MFGKKGKEAEIDKVIECKELSCCNTVPHNHGQACIGCLWIPLVATGIRCRSDSCLYQEPHDHGFDCYSRCWCGGK